jgi:hypothetical protein
MSVVILFYVFDYLEIGAAGIFLADINAYFCLFCYCRYLSTCVERINQTQCAGEQVSVHEFYILGCHGRRIKTIHRLVGGSIEGCVKCRNSHCAGGNTQLGQLSVGDGLGYGATSASQRHRLGWKNEIGVFVHSDRRHTKLELGPVC